MTPKSSSLAVFLSFKFLFVWKLKTRKKKMHPLSFLSLILTAISLFIPILVLSITNGFQFFTQSKLESFYAPYSLKLPKPLLSSTLPQDSRVKSFYEDFVLLKGTRNETPSLIRALENKEINALIKKGSLTLKQGTLPTGAQQILLGETLAIQLGLVLGDRVEILTLNTARPSPVLSSLMVLGGIISFSNASLDRLIAMIPPASLSNVFLLNPKSINQITSLQKKDLVNLSLKQGMLSSLADIPSVKQMKKQKNLLLLLVLSSTFVCFFSLYMNLKTNMSYHLYSLHVLRFLGLEQKTLLQLFFIQNVLLTALGVGLGLLLCLGIIPFIGEILVYTEKILNSLLFILQHSFSLLKNKAAIEFMPKDIFYLQTIPIKLQLSDFMSIIGLLFTGVVGMNLIHHAQLSKKFTLQSLKTEQGV